MKKSGSLLGAAVLTLGLVAASMAADVPTTAGSSEVNQSSSQKVSAAKKPKSATGVTTHASGTPAIHRKALRVPITGMPKSEPPSPPPPPPPPPK